MSSGVPSVGPAARGQFLPPLHPVHPFKETVIQPSFGKPGPFGHRAFQWEETDTVLFSRILLESYHLR